MSISYKAMRCRSCSFEALELSRRRTPRRSPARIAPGLGPTHVGARTHTHAHRRAPTSRRAHTRTLSQTRTPARRRRGCSSRSSTAPRSAPTRARSSCEYSRTLSRVRVLPVSTLVPSPACAPCVPNAPPRWDARHWPGPPRLIRPPAVSTLVPSALHECSSIPFLPGVSTLGFFFSP